MKTTITILAILLFTIVTAEAQTQFIENIVSTNTTGMASVFAIDIDNDGDIDIISSSDSENKISWYENDGSESFIMHNISTNESEAHAVKAVDMDGDDDIDIIAILMTGLVWYENDGNQNFSMHTINSIGGHSIFDIDLDEDGDIDIVVAENGQTKWYENNGEESFTEHNLSTQGWGANHVVAIDIDNDDDIDILSLNDDIPGVILHKNNGGQVFTEEIIIDTLDIKKLSVIDINNDGNIDALGIKYDGNLYWYENVGLLNYSEHFISYYIDGIFPFDVDNDGDIDILAYSIDQMNHNLSNLLWLENDNQLFTKHIITIGNLNSLFAIDINSDNRVDLLTSSYEEDVLWYKNCSVTHDDVTVTICGNYISPSGKEWTTSGIYKDTILNFVGCDSIITFDLTIQEPYNQQLCLVSVDPITGKNKIVWEGNENVGTESYVIQKALSTNNYTPIDIVDASEPSEYIDWGSDPAAHSDFYKISVIDTCGNPSDIENAVYHKTINMTLSHVGSTMSLNWEQYEVEDDSYVPSTYKIYRGTEATNMVEIDEINGMLRSYNDLNIFQEYHYMVGAVRGDCGLGGDKSFNAEYTIFSNKKDNKDFIGIIERSSYLPIKIYPNPVSTYVQVKGLKLKGESKLTITDISGKQVKQLVIQDSEFKIPVEDLESGTYFLTIKGDKVYRGKFVKE